MSDYRDVAGWCEGLHWRPEFYADRGESIVLTASGPALVSHRVSEELSLAFVAAALAETEPGR